MPENRSEAEKQQDRQQDGQFAAESRIRIMRKKTPQKLQKYNGFTLVELMVSMVISSLVIAGIFGVYTIQQRSYTVQEQVSELQQRGRSALAFMAQDIRMAGYDDADSNCTSGEITTANPTRFTFNTCDGNSSTPVTITYGLYDAFAGIGQNNGLTDDLFRQVDGGNQELILEGVDGFEFLYFDGNGNSLGTAAADPDDVETVQISILVRSSYPDPKQTDSVLYRSGSVLENPASTWTLIGEAAGNPPNDHYHRRLLITSVQLRNM